MFIVIESYDGEINVDLCANIESALYKKKDYIESLADNFNYNELANEEKYFSAEVNDMIYTVEIRQEPIFNINIL